MRFRQLEIMVFFDTPIVVCAWFVTTLQAIVKLQLSACYSFPQTALSIFSPEGPNKHYKISPHQQDLTKFSI